jgi:hypothetical protein
VARSWLIPLLAGLIVALLAVAFVATFNAVAKPPARHGQVLPGRMMGLPTSAKHPTIQIGTAIECTPRGCIERGRKP